MADPEVRREGPSGGPARFFRTTVVGGVVFLIPIVVLLVVIGKAFGLVHKAMAPLARMIPVQTVAGIPTPRLLAVAAIVLFCFLAGLFARTRFAKRLVGWLESALLSNIPGYSFMKSMGESIAGVESAKAHEVVLARIEDAWQIAFLVERIPGGQVAVFVPGAPDPWSGSLYLMTEDRIKHLDVPLSAALKCVKRLGMGSSELVRGGL